MNKMICEKCGNEITAESVAVFSVCGNCGAGVQPPPTKEENASSKNAAPAPKSKKRLIYAAFFFALLSLPLLYLGGLYWFIVRQPEGPNGYSIRLPDWTRPKPTPRAKKSGSISASEITRIEYTDSKYQKPEYATG